MSKQHYRVEGYTSQSNIGYMLKRAHSLILDAMEPELEARGYSFVQYVIMAWLRDGIAVNPKDFCARFRHDSGALTRVIDQLVARGLVERNRGERDRRTVELQLTKTGLATVEGLLPLVVAKLNLALADFSAAEVKELMRLLLKLNTTLESVVAVPAPLAAAAAARS
jgi:DNA-binding MarR family transcriptional regulator